MKRKIKLDKKKFFSGLDFKNMVDTKLLLVSFWTDSQYCDFFLVHAYHWERVKKDLSTSCGTISISTWGGQEPAQMQLKAYIALCSVCDSQQVIQNFQRKLGGKRHLGMFDAWKPLADLLKIRMFPDTFYQHLEPKLYKDMEQY